MFSNFRFLGGAFWSQFYSSPIVSHCFWWHFSLPFFVPTFSLHFGFTFSRSPLPPFNYSSPSLRHHCMKAISSCLCQFFLAISFLSYFFRCIFAAMLFLPFICYSSFFISWSLFLCRPFLTTLSFLVAKFLSTCLLLHFFVSVSSAPCHVAVSSFQFISRLSLITNCSCSCIFHCFFVATLGRFFFKSVSSLPLSHLLIFLFLLIAFCLRLFLVISSSLLLHHRFRYLWSVIIFLGILYAHL